DPADSLIVTSIQKMSNIDEENGGLKAADLAIICSKRIVFIIDECHRSTFGDMLLTIKRTFPRALFFGFTGTPIERENQKKMNTTATVFGNELHRYSIADGIRDRNVLGFDPYMVLTYKDNDVRTVVALEKAKAATVEEALADPGKKQVFLTYMNTVPMAGVRHDDGSYDKGIEDFIPNSQYRTDEHQSMVVKDILDNWVVLSQGSKFHAIFATHSIPEALEYYHRFKAEAPDLKVTALFDPSIDNSDGARVKEDGLLELIGDYNARYGQDFTAPSFQKMKKDIAARLAHKKPYERIDREPDKQIDLLIVVDQMLTGFDSKWIDTLYMDKMLSYENVIQAFSRTNRLFGPDKPFGTIKYYRRPHTMERNIAEAVKLYSGDKPLGLFAQRLPQNLTTMNLLFSQISDLFEASGVKNFESLPADKPSRRKFALLFKQFNEYLEAAKIQGFAWNRLEYVFTHEDSGEKETITLALDERTYLILVKRYKELFSHDPSSGIEETPYEIEGYLTTIDTDKIDTDYMNSRFVKFLKLLHQDGASRDELQRVEDELHNTFASLSQDEQKYANIFLHDIQRGDVQPEEGKTFRDYITLYVSRAKDDQIHRLAFYALGLNEEKLREMMSLHVTEANINEFGRFDALKATIDKTKAKAYFEAVTGKKMPLPMVNTRADKLLRDFILNGGFDIDLP
ncbi:MAG: type I restriction endonuclease subunit R, partial [Butyrivibrio sp.]